MPEAIPELSNSLPLPLQAPFRAFWRCSHDQSCGLTPFDQSICHIKSAWLLATFQFSLHQLWGFVPYLPNSRHVHHYNKPFHKSTTRAGALVTSNILPGWRATRVGPGQYRQYLVHPKWREAVGSSQAPQPNRPNAHKSHAQLPHQSQPIEFLFENSASHNRPGHVFSLPQQQKIDP